MLRATFDCRTELEDKIIRFEYRTGDDFKSKRIRHNTGSGSVQIKRGLSFFSGTNSCRFCPQSAAYFTFIKARRFRWRTAAAATISSDRFCAEDHALPRRTRYLSYARVECHRFAKTVRFRRCIRRWLDRPDRCFDDNFIGSTVPGVKKKRRADA